MDSLSSTAEPITQSSRRITSQLNKSKLDYVFSGYLKFTNGDYKGSISDYSEAVRLNPRDAQAYYLRAGVNFLLGDSYGAISDYTEAILIEPKISAFHKARGDVKEELG
ncbi:MAG: tetratricopeptide repeat protein, partial [Pseudanabaena sp.]